MRHVCYHSALTARGKGLLSPMEKTENGRKGTRGLKETENGLTQGKGKATLESFQFNAQL